jgi:hypothetical protein
MSGVSAANVPVLNDSSRKSGRGSRDHCQNQAMSEPERAPVGRRVQIIVWPSAFVAAAIMLAVTYPGQGSVGTPYLVLCALMPIAAIVTALVLLRMFARLGSSHDA